MSAPAAARPYGLTVADLLERFGPIPDQRVCKDPAPGEATEADVVALHLRDKRLYELVDGVLIEKAMGLRESILACALIRIQGDFVQKGRLGLVAGEGGMMRMAPGLVRIPDVSFIRWERFPDRKVPQEPVPHLVPDLAVEVLSAGLPSRR